MKSAQRIMSVNGRLVASGELSVGSMLALERGMSGFRTYLDYLNIEASLDSSEKEDIDRAFNMFVQKLTSVLEKRD